LAAENKKKIIAMRLIDQEGKNLSPKKMYSASQAVFKTGLGIVAVALLFWAWNFVAILTTMSAKGTVVSVDIHTHQSVKGKTSNTYSPTFSFVDETGETHEASVRFPASNYNFEVGDKMTVGYDPEGFSYVIIVDWWVNSRMPLIVLAVAGLVFWASASICKTGQQWEAEGRHG